MIQPTASYLNDVFFGMGIARRTPEVCERAGIVRPLVVSDATLIEMGMHERIGFADAPRFDAVSTNPTEPAVLGGLEAYRQADCDGIVAVGGGSPLDVAKAIALMVDHPPPLEQYSVLQHPERIRKAVPPTIAVPTTAGSGSEVGRAALITLSTGQKRGFISPSLLPRAAVCDPELTRTLPPVLKAATGMDAICHCLETFCSPRENPVADALALDGFARGMRAIDTAVSTDDAGAQAEMMWCSVMGGMAFQKGLGAVHALSHPLGAWSDPTLHHGTLNAVFLPHVLRFNAEACPARLDRLAAAIGLADADSLIERFERLPARLGLPHSLQVMGVQWTPQQLNELVERAIEDHCVPTNPRPLDVPACRILFEAALRDVRPRPETSTSY